MVRRALASSNSSNSSIVDRESNLSLGDGDSSQGDEQPLDASDCWSTDSCERCAVDFKLFRQLRKRATDVTLQSGYRLSKMKMAVGYGEDPTRVNESVEHGNGAIEENEHENSEALAQDPIRLPKSFAGYESMFMAIVKKKIRSVFQVISGFHRLRSRNVQLKFRRQFQDFVSYLKIKEEHRLENEVNPSNAEMKPESDDEEEFRSCEGTSEDLSPDFFRVANPANGESEISAKLVSKDVDQTMTDLTTAAINPITAHSSTINHEKPDELNGRSSSVKTAINFKFFRQLRKKKIESLLLKQYIDLNLKTHRQKKNAKIIKSDASKNELLLAACDSTKKAKTAKQPSARYVRKVVNRVSLAVGDLKRIPLDRGEVTPRATSSDSHGNMVSKRTNNSVDSDGWVTDTDGSRSSLGSEWEAVGWVDPTQDGAGSDWVDERIAAQHRIRTTSLLIGEVSDPTLFTNAEFTPACLGHESMLVAVASKHKINSFRTRTTRRHFKRQFADYTAYLRLSGQLSQLEESPQSRTGVWDVYSKGNAGCAELVGSSEGNSTNSSFVEISPARKSSYLKTIR